MRRKKWLIIAPVALLGLLLFITLGGLIVQQLWNWLLPTLFGLPSVTFWQALGLLVLSRVLFGGLGVRGGPRPGSGVRHRIAGHWSRLTPEERERFRQRMRARFGFDAGGPTEAR